MQKISIFHLFNFEIQSILESHDQTGHAHFWLYPPKKLLINFYFMLICINIYKIRLFHWFVLEILLIKKSCNLIGWEYFGQYLRNKNFHKYVGICRNIANNITFHYITNSVKKFMTKVVNKLKKPCFWPIFSPFSQFLGKKTEGQTDPIL